MPRIQLLGSLAVLAAAVLVGCDTGSRNRNTTSTSGQGGGSGNGSGNQGVAPTASFTWSPTSPSGAPPVQVTFTDVSTGSPTSWLWNFGDGGSSTQQNPSHTYQQPGVYSVAMIASNAHGGDSVTATDLVTVINNAQGSPFWYEQNTYGNPYKTHTAAEAQFVQDVLTLLNQERAAASLPALTNDAEAELAAKVHSEDMFGRNYFSHVTPEGWTPNDRLQMTGASGYSKTAENIAALQQTAQDLVNLWMGSPPHRANILDPDMTHVGIGHALGGPVSTAVFLKRP